MYIVLLMLKWAQSSLGDYTRHEDSAFTFEHEQDTMTSRRGCAVGVRRPHTTHNDAARNSSRSFRTCTTAFCSHGKIEKEKRKVTESIHSEQLMILIVPEICSIILSAAEKSYVRC